MLIADNVKQRQDVCDKCEFKVNNKCTKCGCWTKAKTLYKGSVCPLHKWGCKYCEVK